MAQTLLPINGVYDRDSGVLVGLLTPGGIVQSLTTGGSGSVGTYANTTLLQAAYPAAANIGSFANIGSTSPYTLYTSNGSAWVTVGGAAGGVVGTFTSTGNLQTAFPAASYAGYFANVGSGAPYTLYVSNGSAWVLNASAGGAAWGSVTGTLSAQSDVWNALNGQSINVQTGTAYTLLAADAGQEIDMSNSAPNTLTIPNDTTLNFPVGTTFLVCQVGTGATTIAVASGVTYQQSASRSLTISTQYETATLKKVAANTWRLWVN